MSDNIEIWRNECGELGSFASLADAACDPDNSFGWESPTTADLTGLARGDDGRLFDVCVAAVDLDEWRRRR